jgi:hypothetical protein
MKRVVRVVGGLRRKKLTFVGVRRDGTKLKAQCAEIVKKEYDARREAAQQKV